MELAKAIEAWLEQNGAGLSGATRRDIETIGSAASDCDLADTDCSALTKPDRARLVDAAAANSSLSKGAIGTFLDILITWGTPSAKASAQPTRKSAVSDDPPSLFDAANDEPAQDDLVEKDASPSALDGDDDHDRDYDDDHDDDDDRDYDDDHDDDDDDDHDDDDDDDDHDHDDDDHDDDHDDDDHDDDDHDDDDHDDDDDDDDHDDDDDRDYDDDDDDDDDRDYDGDDGDDGDDDDDDDDDDRDYDGDDDDGDDDDDDDDRGYDDDDQDDDDTKSAAQAFRAAAAASAVNGDATNVSTESDGAGPSVPPGFDEASQAGGVFSAQATTPRGQKPGVDWVTVLYFSIAAICFALVIAFYLMS